MLTIYVNTLILVYLIVCFCNQNEASCSIFSYINIYSYINIQYNTATIIKEFLKILSSSKSASVSLCYSLGLNPKQTSPKRRVSLLQTPMHTGYRKTQTQKVGTLKL